MDEFPVVGQLPVRSESLVPDHRFLTENLAEVSVPQADRNEGERTQLYRVEFTATQSEWRSIQPELRKREIVAKLYETPHRYLQARQDEEWLLAAMDRKRRRQYLAVAVAAMAATCSLILILLVKTIDPCWFVGSLAVILVAIRVAVSYTGGHPLE
jgi:hypothetical protein